MVILQTAFKTLHTKRSGLFSRQNFISSHLCWNCKDNIYENLASYQMLAVINDTCAILISFTETKANFPTLLPTSGTAIFERCYNYWKMSNRHSQWATNTYLLQVCMYMFYVYIESKNHTKDNWTRFSWRNFVFYKLFVNQCTYIII